MYFFKSKLRDRSGAKDTREAGISKLAGIYEAEEIHEASGVNHNEEATIFKPAGIDEAKENHKVSGVKDSNEAKVFKLAGTDEAKESHKMPEIPLPRYKVTDMISTRLLFCHRLYHFIRDIVIPKESEDFNPMQIIIQKFGDFRDKGFFKHLKDRPEAEFIIRILIKLAATRKDYPRPQLSNQYTKKIIKKFDSNIIAFTLECLKLIFLCRDPDELCEFYGYKCCQPPAPHDQHCMITKWDLFNNYMKSYLAICFVSGEYNKAIKEIEEAMRKVNRVEEQEYHSIENLFPQELPIKRQKEKEILENIQVETPLAREISYTWHKVKGIDNTQDKDPCNSLEKSVLDGNYWRSNTLNIYN